MRAIALFFIGFIWIFSLPPAKADSEPAAMTEEEELFDECTPYSQAEMPSCLRKLVDESSKKLAIAEKEMLSSIDNSSWGKDGRDWEKKYIRLAKSNFIRSKNEFARFRKIHCDFDESLAFGATSSSHTQGQLRCQLKLNHWRTKQLKGLADEIKE